MARDSARAAPPPHATRVARGPSSLDSSGAALDAATRRSLESRFGHDFSRVRIHTDAASAREAEAMDAVAYTSGDHIVFGEGAYQPRTAEGRRLLAHELTHVVQQSSAPGPASARPSGAARERQPRTGEAHAESEADRASDLVTAGRSVGPVSAVPAGAIQRQGKPKTSVSGERKGTKEGKDNFSFKAELTVPLITELTHKFEFGKVAFLDELKLAGAGGVTGEALGASSAELDDLKLQLALTLARLELASAKNKAEELRKGKLSLGATLSATGGGTYAFDPFDPKGSLGASLTAKAGATTPSLIPSKYGELTVGGTLSATGSVAQEAGIEGPVTPKAEAKYGVEAAFKSPASRALALGGALGEEAQVTAGIEESISGSVTPEKGGVKLGAGASLGLAGKTKGGGERFIKLQVTGDVSIDRKAGEATTTTSSIFVGASTGFKF